MRKQKIISLIIAVLLVIQMAPVCAAATDNNYNEKNIRAISVMKAFGVSLQGENDDYTTKGEFARAILRIIDTSKTLSNEDSVARLVEMGLYPSDKAQSVEGNISVGTVAETVVKLLGYKVWADKDGVMATASKLKLFTGVKADENAPVKNADCYRIFYNMLDVYLFADESIRFDSNLNDTVLNSFVDKSRTALFAFFDAEYLTVEVLADKQSSVIGYENFCKEDFIYTNYGYIDIRDCRIHGYVGKKINIYVKYEDGDMVAVCFFEGATKGLVIDMKDIMYAKGFDATDNLESKSNPKICYKGNKIANIAKRFTVLYNGFSANNINNADFTGEYGKVELLDTNNDSKYEIVYITQSLYLEVANTDVIEGNIIFKKPYTYIETEDNDVNIYNNGRKISCENVTADSFVEIRTHKMNNIADELSKVEEADIFVLSGVKNAVAAFVDKDNKIIGIGDKSYEALADVADIVSPGKNYDFVMSSDGIIVDAKHSSNASQYAYFIGYEQKGSFTKKLKIGYYTMAREYKETELTDCTVFTGYDENNIWQVDKKYKKEEMAKILDTHFADGKRALLCISIADNGNVTFVMPRNMELESDYQGFNNDEFTLEHEITSSEKSKLTTFGFLSDNYTATAKTKIIVDDINDKDNLKILSYGSDHSAVAGPSKFMQKGYLYDSDEGLYPSVVVLQCDFSVKQNANWYDLLKGLPLVIGKVKGARLTDGTDCYLIEGYRNDSYVKLYTEDTDISADYQTPFSVVTNKTKVSELAAGDVIIPIIDNFTGHISGFMPILTPDSEGNSEEFANSYWGAWAPDSSFNAAFSTLSKNYNNKTFKISLTGDKLYPMPKVVYLYDISSKKLKKCDKGTYLYDLTSANADKIFIAANKNVPRFIVVYRD